MAQVGAPSGYKGQETLDKAREYMEQCEDTYDEVHFSKFGKVAFTVNLPKAAGLAIYLGVHKATLYTWAQKYPEFNDILMELNQLQEQRLLDNTLAGKYNPHIAKLVLGKHGYKDQSEVETIVTDERLTPEQRSKLDKLLED